MAKKTIRVSDKSGTSLPDGQGATVRVTYDDARKGSVVLDVTAAEADQIAEGGQKVARRGRKPSTSSV